MDLWTGIGRMDYEMGLCSEIENSDSQMGFLKDIPMVLRTAAVRMD